MANIENNRNIEMASKLRRVSCVFISHIQRGNGNPIEIRKTPFLYLRLCVRAHKTTRDAPICTC